MDLNVPRTMSTTADINPTSAFGGVLEFWFGALLETTMPPEEGMQIRRWYGKDPSTDREMREQFSGLHGKVTADIESGWTPLGIRNRLATVIILDQFPRNMYRDTPEMYGTDHLALDLARISLIDKAADELDLYRAMFLFMPLMHSEELADQEVMLEKFMQFRERAAARNLPSLPFFEMAEKFAARHLEIVARFGRFPHRNAILGRHTTDEETAFLHEDDSSF